jgi:hypothetical protein
MVGGGDRGDRGVEGVAMVKVCGERTLQAKTYYQCHEASSPSSEMFDESSRVG